MRMRNKPWAKDWIAEHPDIVVLDPEKIQGEWNKLFQNNAPIHIEIGMGKGRFVTEMAKLHPNINFIGIELEDSIIVTAVQNALDLALPNIKLLNVNAQDIDQFFAEGEVDEIYLNFSDPWPKNRHEKRRLTYKSFLDVYKKVLRPGGQLNLKTDNQGLFEYSLESFSGFGLFIKAVNLNLHASVLEGNVMTEYEEKFSNQGHRIYRCEAVFQTS